MLDVIISLFILGITRAMNNKPGLIIVLLLLFVLAGIIGAAS